MKIMTWKIVLILNVFKKWDAVDIKKTVYFLHRNKPFFYCEQIKSGFSTCESDTTYGTIRFLS